MKVIVFDPGDLAGQAFIAAAAAVGLEALVARKADEALTLFIRNADTGAAAFFLPPHQPDLVYEMIPRFRKVNPNLALLAVFADPVSLEEVRADLVRSRVQLIALAQGLPGVASSLALLAGDGKAKRREHRVDWRLRAMLYNHDELDHKLVETGRLAEVISLSANGAYIATSRFEPENGRTYIFEITLPDFIFLVKGRVVWTNLEGTVGDRPRGFALRFEEMSQVPQQLLKNLIEADMIDTILRGQSRA